MEMMYQGEQAGHFRFYLSKVDGEVEFIPDVNGALVGGASLDAADFLAIARAATS